MLSNNRRQGRVHAHDHDLVLPADHDDLVNEILSHDMAMKTRRNYRNRQKNMMAHWKEHHPEFYALAVVDVSEEDQHDKSMYFFDGAFKKDLVYTGLNIDYVLKFLMKTKKKQDGKLKSEGDLKKYKDAIMWGAQIVDNQLPISFYRGFDKFMAGYKKESLASVARRGEWTISQTLNVYWHFGR